MNTFLISDTHFSHLGVTKFLTNEGLKLRPWDDVDEMDEAMVDNWNRTVGPKDKVYHGGDVAINRRGIKILARLNGIKVLIRGNHDIFKLEDYAPYFKDIRGFHVLDKFAISHIPIHVDSLSRWECNIHGHLHSNKVMKKEVKNGVIIDVEDTRYFNICVEQINYTPIAFEDLKKRIRDRIGS